MGILSPSGLGSYIGQEKVKKNITVCIEASKKRPLTTPLDHILFAGPSGTGKTSMAEVIAKELYVPVEKFMGPRLDNISKLDFLCDIELGTIVFIDEIHALPRKVEEALYDPMDNFKWNGKDIMPFTLIGATTREGYLSKPLHSRFTIIETLELYSNSELFGILKRSAELMKVKLEDKAAMAIAKRSRGTPRMANQLLKRVGYYGKDITSAVAKEAMDNIGIDEYGCDRVDRSIIKTIHKSFGNGPVGIDSLASILGEDIDTIEILREPHLVKIGFIQRSDRGRILTPRGIDYAKKV